MNDTLIEEKIDISQDMIDGDIADYFALKIKGNTYHPLYMDGDTVLFCRDLTKENISNVYAVKINGQAELRHFEYTNEENKVCLSGISPRVPPLYLTPEEYKVLGVPYLLMRELSKECK